MNERYISKGLKITEGFIQDNKGESLDNVTDIIERLNIQNKIIEDQKKIWRKSEKDFIKLQSFYKELKKEIDICKDLYENNDMDVVLGFIKHKGFSLQEVAEYKEETKK